MKQTPGTVTGRHLLITGPIRGAVELEDGRTVDVAPGVIEVSDQDEADEVSFLIGERYRVEGHPDDVEYDEDAKAMVQRPFVHAHPAKFNARKDKRKSAGTPAKNPKKG